MVIRKGGMVFSSVGLGYRELYCSGKMTAGSTCREAKVDGGMGGRLWTTLTWVVFVRPKKTE